MFASELTIFDLVETTTHLVAAGGGGDPEYGKANGIIVILKPSKEDCKDDELSGSFFGTDDIIRHIATYEEGTDCLEFQTDEDIEEASTSSSAAPCESEDYAATLAGSTESGSGRNKPVRFFIAAAGLSFFYLLEFNGEFRLLRKLSGEIGPFYFTRHLIFLKSGNFNGFYDVIGQPENIHIKETQPSADINEEFFYSGFRKGNEIICRCESGTSNIPNNWSNFFVRDRFVHKVLHNSGESSFVFNNIKYSYEGEIPRIEYNNGMVIFYVLQENGSLLVFLKDKEVVYKLPRITCMRVKGKDTAIATVTGDVILYRDDVFISKTFISPIPISGICLDKSLLYYSTITGHIGLRTIRAKNRTLWLLAALLIVVIAVWIKFWKN